MAEMAKPPRVAHKRVSVPSLDVVHDVIEAAERRDPRLAPTGMRRGELCALRWSDVDLDTGTLHVTRSVVVVPSGLAEKTTKTDRGRSVALDPVGVAVMTQHRARSTRWVREAGVVVAPNAFVFSPSVEATTPLRPDNVTSFFIRVRNEVGAPQVRLHDLRHFIATQLIGAGVDVRTVAGRLGHSDPSVTLRVYSHALEERDRAAAAVMGGCWTRPCSEQWVPKQISSARATLANPNTERTRRTGERRRMAARGLRDRGRTPTVHGLGGEAVRDQVRRARRGAPPGPRRARARPGP